MSLAEEYHVARKLRLARLGAVSSPYQAPIPVRVIEPQAFDEGWESMWFFDLLRAYREPRISVPVKEIQAVVCRYYDVHSIDLVSARRGKKYAHPRQVGMYLCRRLTPLSFAQIGRHFGGKDHTTAMYAAQKIEAQIPINAELAYEITSLRRSLA